MLDRPYRCKWKKLFSGYAEATGFGRRPDVPVDQAFLHLGFAKRRDRPARDAELPALLRFFPSRAECDVAAFVRRFLSRLKPQFFRKHTNLDLSYE